jgi:hypothetical protein
MPRLYLPKCLAQTIHGRLEEEAHRVRDAKDTAGHPSAGVTHSPPRKAPRNPPWCGRSVELLDPPGNKPDTRVREADLIGHRCGDV